MAGLAGRMSTVVKAKVSKMLDRAEDPARIAQTVQAVMKLRGRVSRVPAGSLPADGKVIEDRRKLD